MRAAALQPTRAKIRAALYLAVGLALGLTFWLRREAGKWDADLNDVTLTISQKSGYDIRAFLRNGSVGPVQVAVYDTDLEVRLSHNWQRRQMAFRSCGVIGSQSFKLAPGEEVEFNVLWFPHLFQSGETVSLVVNIESGLKFGTTRSQPIVLAGLP